MRSDLDDAGWATYESERRSFRDTQRERPDAHIDLETIREEQLIRSARIGAAAASTCSHPDGFIRLDGEPQTYDFGDGESEVLQGYTCLCCTASFTRVVLGS